MMFAAVGLGELLWSLLVVFVMVQYLLLLFTVIVDLFRSDDLGGWGKAGWALALFFFPLIALIAYLVARSEGMNARAASRGRDLQRAFDDHVRDVAGSVAPATELQTAKALLDDGVLTAEEFEALKRRILA